MLPLSIPRRQPPFLTGLVLALATSTAPAWPQSVVIHEIRVTQEGAENDEYFELRGPAGTSLNGLTYLVIGDSPAGGSGVIEEVTSLTGNVLPASGFFVVAEGTFSLGVADVTVTLTFEDDDNVTHLLVSGFSGVNGQDLDTNDDGVLDLTPWAAVVDRIALIREPNPPATTEFHYGPPALGPDGFDSPWHAVRCGTSWSIGHSAAGVADTPGAAGTCCETPDCYYGAADHHSQATLRQSLHEIIDDHRRTSYDVANSWIVLEAADEDPVDPASILDLYRNETYVKVGGGGGPYQREHTWPQSYGFPTNTGTGAYPRSDYHAIFLCDSVYNNARSNRPFDTCDDSCEELPTVLNHGQGGSGGGHPGDSNWRTGSGTAGTWEVWRSTPGPGGRRGDVARALFFMDVRYDGSDHIDGTPEPDLVLVDDRAQLHSDSTNPQDPATMGMLATLLEWHEEDPVDDRERARNEVLFFFQRNRNPFIDHPEWVQCAFTGACGIFADGFESGGTGAWGAAAKRAPCPHLSVDLSRVPATIGARSRNQEPGTLPGWQAELRPMSGNQRGVGQTGMQSVADINRAIAVMKAQSNLGDHTAVEALVASCVDPKDAEWLVALLPVAFTRVLFKGTGPSFANTYQCMGGDGSVSREYRLSDEPIFVLGLRIAGTADRETMMAIAGRSAEFNVINQALHAGSKLEDLVLTPPLFLRASKSQPAKPWWRFW